MDSLRTYLIILPILHKVCRGLHFLEDAKIETLRGQLHSVGLRDPKPRGDVEKFGRGCITKRVMFEFSNIKSLAQYTSQKQ